MKKTTNPHPSSPRPSQLKPKHAPRNTHHAGQDALDWAERSASIREREWEIVDDLLDALQRRLDADVIQDATLADIARALSLASKIGRLATGLAATPPADIPAEDPRARELNDALEQIARNFQAKQAAAAAAASNPQPPSTPNP